MEIIVAYMGYLTWILIRSLAHARRQGFWIRRKNKTDGDYFPLEKEMEKSGNFLVRCLCGALADQEQIDSILIEGCRFVRAHLEILSPPEMRRLPGRCLLMNECGRRGRGRALGSMPPP
jgi:hypothetical protein